MVMDVHLRDLRYFVAVADELSFTRAAERLHLSQPALSKQVAGLENALRARLLRRDRRRVELTAAGAALHSAARKLLAEWDQAVAVVADAAAAEARVLRAGTLTSLGRALFPAVLEQFGKLQPGWQVELRSFGWGDPTAGLVGQETDAAFVWLPAGSDEIDTEVLVTERRLVAVASAHPLAGRDEVRFAEIAAEPFAALPASAGLARDFWLGTGERDGRLPRIAAEVTSADEVFELVSAGAAVVLLAEGNAAVYARPGITCIPVTGLEPARLAIAWRRGDRRACVADFVRACRDAARLVTGADTAYGPSQTSSSQARSTTGR
jgi:DNA-binding transcriptional LysR family regulator